MLKISSTLWEYTHAATFVMKSVCARLHAKLLDAFAEAQQRFDIEGVSEKLLLQLRNFLISWLVNHIMQIDVHLKACIKE